MGAKFWTLGLFGGGVSAGQATERLCTGVHGAALAGGWLFRAARKDRR